MLTFRFFFLLVPLLFLVACEENDQRPAETPPSPLENVTRTAFSDAFQRLDAQGYAAELTYREGSPGSLGPKETILLRVEDNEIHVAETSEDVPDKLNLRLRDPLPYLLPEDPPYLDPRTREFYTIETGVGEEGDTLVTAELKPDSPRDLPIHRVEARIADGQPVAVTLLRQSEALLMDETEQAVIQLTPFGNAWIPSHVELHTTIDLPGRAPLSMRQTWNVLDVGGTSLEE